MVPRAFFFPGVVFLSLCFAANASAYIHFTPKSLADMCKISYAIRILKVEKFDKEKGVILFDLVETLKTRHVPLAWNKHVIPPKDEAMKPVLDWLAKGKTAVIFTIEACANMAERNIGCGYVFIDEYCYSVDYNDAGHYWYLLRAKPQLSEFYFGTAEELRELTRSTLDGKKVTVPTKEPRSTVSFDQRNKEVNEMMRRNKEGP